jgi:ABC-type Mn2+/Zn2+ transport system permease subunit
MAISTGLSVSSVWIGLASSAMFNLPPSFLIVAMVSAIWLAVWLGAARVLATATHAEDTPAQKVPGASEHC